MLKRNINQMPMLPNANMPFMPNVNAPVQTLPMGDKGGKGAVMPMLPGGSCCVHPTECCVAPPVIHPTECCVVNTCSHVIVPHIHPVHTQYVNHEVIQNQHQLQPSTSYSNVVQEVNSMAPPAPVSPYGFPGAPYGGFPGPGMGGGPFGGPFDGPFGGPMGVSPYGAGPMGVSPYGVGPMHGYHNNMAPNNMMPSQGKGK